MQESVKRFYLILINSYHVLMLPRAFIKFPIKNKRKKNYRIHEEEMHVLCSPKLFGILLIYTI